MKACVLTPWIGDGSTGNPFRPLICDIFSVSWSDVTGQPAENLTPDPNMYVIELTCDEATLAAIEADTRFLVLWSDNA